MPMIEVDESVFTQNETLRKTVAAMLQNPAARRKVLEAQKLINPDASIPELDAAAPIEGAMATMRKELDDFKALQLKERQDAEDQKKLDGITAKMERGFDELRQNGVTEEGIAGVRKLMEDEGILNPRIAWDHFSKLHPPTEPTNPAGYGGFNFFDASGGAADDDVMKKLLDTRGDDDSLLRRMTNTALADVRGQPRTR